MRALTIAIASAMLIAGCAVGNDRTSPVIRMVRVTGTGCTSTNLATGFVVSPGRVMTVAHVLHDAAAIQIDGQPASVVAYDERIDAAVLAVDDLDAQAEFAAPTAPTSADVLRWRDRRVQRVGVQITGIPPIEFEVTAKHVTYTRAGVLIDHVSVAGDSGAPILNPSGRVVGMIFATPQADTPLAYAVSATELELFATAPVMSPGWVGKCGT